MDGEGFHDAEGDVGGGADVEDYAFTGTSHDLARMKQGWGTASAGNLYQQAQGNNWQLPILVNETDVLTGGQTATYTL
ncbi:hypothetical protein H1V43_40390, partial [Streptomyces sp. PSKA54]